MVKKLSDLYLEARRALLTQEEPSDASLLARELLCHITGLSREKVIAGTDYYVQDAQCQEMDQAVQRLLSGEPLAYILGKWEFYGLELYVDKNVLIPRDDTCALVSMAIQKALFLGKNPRILDLCTGSGCIGLAVASRVPDAKLTLADISKEALAVAKKNTTSLKLTGRVSCVQADARKAPAPFLGQFDMILSNPPYITWEDMQTLQPSVKEFEPHLALFGGTDGLDFYRSICFNYKNALKPGGYLGFEFGINQGDDVCRLLEENGFTVVERVADNNGIERAVLAQLGKEDRYGNEENRV